MRCSEASLSSFVLCSVALPSGEKKNPFWPFKQKKKIALIISFTAPETSPLLVRPRLRLLIMRLNVLQVNKFPEKEN